MESKDYKKYRWFFTSSGKLVIGGKSALQNEELLRKFKNKKENHVVMHTALPGSPFSMILAPIENVRPEDLEEAAIFTGCFSRAWREGKKKVKVDIFKLSQLYKLKTMKTGTWGVKQKIQRKSISLELALIKQKNKLRAVPIQTAKGKSKIKIHPGKKDKTLMVKAFQEILPKSSKDEILSALPPGGVTVSRSQK